MIINYCKVNSRGSYLVEFVFMVFLLGLRVCELNIVVGVFDGVFFRVVLM